MGSTLSRLTYHVVFSTKGRESNIIGEIRNNVYRYIGGIIRSEGGVMIQIGGMPDHVHILLTLKPIHTISSVLQKIKGRSSKWINDQNLFASQFAWKEGYGVFTVSESQLPRVINYVRNQESHHRRYNFKEEVVRMLSYHHIEYDELYLWE